MCSHALSGFQSKCREKITNKVKIRASLVAQMIKNLPAMPKTRVQSLGWEESLQPTPVFLQKSLVATAYGVAESWTKWLCNLTLSLWASLVAQTVKYLPAMWETWVRSLGREFPLEKEMETHSSTLTWKIPWTEEPGRLQSMGSQRVGHDWATWLHFSFQSLFS